MKPSLRIISWFLIAVFYLMAEAALSTSEDNRVKVYLFSEPGCPYCRQAETALLKLKAVKDFEFKKITVGSEEQNNRLYKMALKHFGYERTAVPLVVIGEESFIGFSKGGVTEDHYRNSIEICLKVGCQDTIAMLLGRLILAAPTDLNNDAPFSTSDRPSRSVLPETILIPLLGSVSTRDLSLTALTVAMAAIDGFNPCAMWVLVFLIGLLLGLENKQRMWILGGTFLTATGVMYFTVMAAWLNLVLYLEAVAWVRLAIGVLAVGGGVYFLREFWTKPEAACRVTNRKSRNKFMDMFRTNVHGQSLILSMIGIAALAVAVNFIELVCSAGIPAVYMQVLAMNELPVISYYGYLFLYVVVFMLDDIAIFTIAMFAMQVSGLTGQYARYSHLIGGIILIGVGVLLLLRPDLLSFGVA